MRILLTGAGGLLGKKIVKVFSDYEIIGVYNKSKPETKEYINLDLSNLEKIKIIEDFSPDIIIHAAAISNADTCEKEPELAKLINVEATKEIAKIAEKLNAYLIYISTDYVFDGKKGNYSEEDEPNPINIYGLTKLEGEKAVKEIASKYLIVRTSTPYGSNPASMKDNFALWLLKKLKAREKVKIIVDQITNPTLNTSFALMLKESIEKRLTGILHLTDASQLSRYSFSVLLAKTFDLDEKLIIPGYSYELKWIAKRPLNSSLNVNKAMKLLEKHKPLNINTAMKIFKKEVVEENAVFV